MSHFGRSVDELDVDLLSLPRFGCREDRFSDDKRSLSGSNDTTLDEKEVLVDFTIMRESTEWGNVLLNGISLAHSVVGGILRDGSSTNAVDLLVELSSGVVTELTNTSNSPFDCRWMPSSDTGDLAETSMRASLKTRNSESLDDTFSSLTSCNSNGVNAL